MFPCVLFSQLDSSGTSFEIFDWCILTIYFIVLLVIGLVCFRRNTTTDQFTSGGRSLSGWLCGMSIFATYLSSISYLALPGKAFVDNWNVFVFSLALPPSAWIAAHYFVPLYRHTGKISAYSFLENRFGLWARLFASGFYLIFQVARIAVVMYLMALPLAIILGWDIRILILITGVMVILYSLIGGITAVIWADAIQACILLGGAIVTLAIILSKMPNGVGQLVQIAHADGKWSLGSLNPFDVHSATVWVVLLYGLFENLKNFGIDQSYVQRYIASRSEREARISVWVGALLYVPVSSLFLLIGTSLYAYYESHPQALNDIRRVVINQKLVQQGVIPDTPNYAQEYIAAEKHLTREELGDRVFPHFMVTQLPTGIRGLVIAAVFAAAMSTVSTGLNSAATLMMSDFFVRLWSPNASDRRRLWVLRFTTLLWGTLGTLLALLLIETTQSVLDIWWTLSGILGAGIIGLFLLGMTTQHLHQRAALRILVIGLALIIWMTLSKSAYWPEAWKHFISPFHPFLIIVIGPSVMVGLGQLENGRHRRLLKQ